MKYLLTALLALCTISLWSCADSQQKESETQPKPQDLVEIKDGHYKEWYPSKKQVKYEGMLNKNGDREGKWNFYSEKGNLRILLEEKTPLPVPAEGTGGENHTGSAPLADSDTIRWY